jgi:glycosyltransferase involved in cell wall biosynthesis
MIGSKKQHPMNRSSSRLTKLVYVSAARIPSEKAHTYQIMQMCNAFASHGIEVELIHPHRNNSSAMAKIQDVWEHYGIQRSFSITEVPTTDILLSMNRFMHIFPEVIYRGGLRLAFELLMKTYTRSLTRYLTTDEANAYYVRGFRIFESLVQARPWLAPLIFFEAHDEFPQTQPERKRRGQSLQKAAGVITTNDYLKDLYDECCILSSRILVAPNGVDLERITQIDLTQEEAKTRLSLPKDCYMVGYVGRLQTLGREKGVSHLLNAIAQINHEFSVPGIGLCLVGGPDQMIQKYRALANKLGLNEDTVLFAGQVTPTEVPTYLRAFDICAMPFPWTKHYAYYMSPLKLFEYMAAERAIIATDLPAVRKILKHKQNAYLVPPDSSRALAEGIKWMIIHAKKRKNLAKQARKDIEAYTWSNRAARILDFIKASL